MLLVLLLAPSLMAAGSEEELKELEAPFYKFPRNLWREMADVLSGPSWLVMKGYDLRLLKQEPEQLRGEVSLQPPAAALVPYRSPSPKFSRNILISRDFGRYPFQTEPYIAVNPKNPEHIVVGVIDFNLPSVASYVSIDGGVTWDGPFQTRYLEEDLGSGGDPTLAFDRKGNVYFAYISIGTKEFSVGAVPYEEFISSIVLSRSEDGGTSWSRPVSTARSDISVYLGPMREGADGELTLGFLDKPWMTLGPDPKSPDRDIIYVTYTEFLSKLQIFYVMGGELFYFGNPVLESTIKLVRSEDGGISWSDPVALSPTVRKVYGGEQAAGGQFVYTERVVQGSQPVVTKDGTLYVFWLDSTDDGSFEGLAEIWFTKSLDGGRSFTKPTKVVSFLEPSYRPRNAFFRSWGAAFPQAATGPNGEVYLVYTARPPDKRMDDGDIYFVRSLDGGKTWSRPKRINDDETDRFQFFPAIAVAPNGTIHVMWGDFRDDRSEARYHIYYSKSDDKGESWIENARVTDFPSNPNYGFPNGLFIGDYFSVKATDEDVYLTWADTRLGEYGPLNQKIGFARMKPVPSPSIFVSPPRGPAGKDVVIQGFHFQPKQDVFIKVGEVVVATARTNEEGRLTSRIFIPISGEGAHELRVIDASGNVATASFYMEFGFDSLREELKKSLESVQGKIPLLESTATELSKNITKVNEEILKKLGALEERLEKISKPSSELEGRLANLEQVVLVAAGSAVAAVVLAVSSLLFVTRKLR